jgi:hypothetical protein
MYSALVERSVARHQNPVKRAMANIDVDTGLTDLLQFCDALKKLLVILAKTPKAK